MSTRSLTHVKKEGLDSPTLTTIYRQMDGYPHGHGQDIAQILGKRKLVNGYTDASTQVNGMGCAAALLISQLKGSMAGRIYIYEPDKNDVCEEFVYTLYNSDGMLKLQIKGYQDEVLADTHVATAWAVANEVLEAEYEE